MRCFTALNYKRKEKKKEKKQKKVGKSILLSEFQLKVPLGPWKTVTISDKLVFFPLLYKIIFIIFRGQTSDSTFSTFSRLQV